MNILEIQDGVYLAKCYDCNEPVIVYMSKEFIKDGMSFTCGECCVPQVNKNRGIGRPILWGGYKIKKAIDKGSYKQGHADGYVDGYVDALQQMAQQKTLKELPNTLNSAIKDMVDNIVKIIVDNINTNTYKKEC